MRIISWNVNGIRAVEKKWELQQLIDTYSPDILFMQEIKWSPDKFGLLLNNPDGYEAFYNPAEKAWYAGTGIWIAHHLRKYVNEIQTGFAWDPTANEGRVVHLELQLPVTPITKGDKSGSLSESNLPIQQPTHSPILDIFGVYFPNGGKSEQAWQDKLVFYTEFAKRMDELRAMGHFVLWGGDLNCAHHEIDLARPRENDGKIWFHPLERAWLDNRVNDGWHDIWRVKNPDTPGVYSWWDVITRSRERNVGWRIDAWWGESKALEKVINITYLTEQYGSDHCPILVEVES